MQRVAVVMAAGALVLAACGGDDDGGGDSTAASATEVDTCLTDAGFEVTREADMSDAQVLNDEMKELLGLDEVLNFDRAEGFGLGTVQFFVDGDAAQEGHEGVESIRTDEVEIGRIGLAVYDYIGDDSAATVETVEACLGG